MTVSNEPTPPQQRNVTMDDLDRHFRAMKPPAVVEAAPAKRGPLRTTRDVLACIRDVLLIIVLAALLFFGGAVVKGLSDLGSDTGTGTGFNLDEGECIGEVPC